MGVGDRAEAKLILHMAFSLYVCRSGPPYTQWPMLSCEPDHILSDDETSSDKVPAEITRHSVVAK